MKQVLLKVYTQHSYYPEPTDDYGMEILGYWFAHDVGNDSKHWAAWFNNDEYSETDSNATWLEKHGNDIVFGSITDLMTKKNYEIPGKYTVTVAKQNVLELLIVWEKVLKTRPNEIMLVEEDGVYKMFEVQ